MEIISLLVLLLIAIFTLIMALSTVWGLIVTGGVPFVSTSKKMFDEIIKAANFKPGDLVYDLGCGKAHFLIYVAKRAGIKGIGYELSFWPYFWAKVAIKLAGADVKVYRRNFFKADLSNANVVFCYLFPEVMAKLEPKFQSELKPGSKVISNSFKLPNKIPVQEIITNTRKPELGKILIYQY